MPIQFQRTIPVLRIFDEHKAKEFYVDSLGFKLDWEHRFEPNTPVYMQISRGTTVLHLSEHYGDGTPGTTLFVDMIGLEELHHELSAKRYKYFRPGIQHAPWNAKVMALVDPFGNHLRFNQYNVHNADNMQQDSSQGKKQAAQQGRRSRRPRAARRRSRV
jgi:catechol 2,3-dioxygenase-like lactoylglutathione lyase family enzyme